MTIDSGWIRILKQNCPRAFAANIPSKPHVVFIDGQIKLMKSEKIRTWEQFVHVQFTTTVERAFKTGARVVVLGFDNYEHVPVSKAPTQRKRCAKIVTMEFGPDSELPAIIPEAWPMAIRNRIFKGRVVRMVCTNLANMYRGLNDGRTLIIDWMDAPCILGAPVSLPPLFACEASRRGECDIKAFNYIELGPLLIISTDGDYVPMALVQTERARREGKDATIVIHRMLTRIDSEKKRGSSTPGRQYEYVNVPSLLEFVTSSLQHHNEPAVSFAGLVAMTGCDFTLNLPRLGPTKIWSNRSNMSPCKLTVSSLLCVLLHMYIEVYAKGLSSPQSLHKRLRALTALEDVDQATEMMAVYTSLQKQIELSSCIAASMKDKLWRYERCFAHCKNTLWTTEYWRMLELFPSPVGTNESGTCYGYLEDKRGRVIFEGLNE